MTVSVLVWDEETADPSALTDAAASLGREIRLALGIEVNSQLTPAPQGARSGTIATVGTLLAAGLTGSLAKPFLEVIKAWLDSRGRTSPATQIRVTGPDGSVVVLRTGRMSATEVAEAVATLRRALSNASPQSLDETRAP
jgi:hypothetical protein